MKFKIYQESLLTFSADCQTLEGAVAVYMEGMKLVVTLST